MGCRKKTLTGQNITSAARLHAARAHSFVGQVPINSQKRYRGDENSRDLRWQLASLIRTFGSFRRIHIFDVERLPSS